MSLILVPAAREIEKLKAPLCCQVEERGSCRLSCGVECSKEAGMVHQSRVSEAPRPMFYRDGGAGGLPKSPSFHSGLDLAGETCDLDLGRPRSFLQIDSPPQDSNQTAIHIYGGLTALPRQLPALLGKIIMQEGMFWFSACLFFHMFYLPRGFSSVTRCEVNTRFSNRVLPRALFPGVQSVNQLREHASTQLSCSVYLRQVLAKIAACLQSYLLKYCDIIMIEQVIYMKT